MAKIKNVGKPRNYTLESGVYRFGKSATYCKKSIYKFIKKDVKNAAPAAKPLFVEKKVGGAESGETRMVNVTKLANDYPTKDPAPKGNSENLFSGHARKLRASLAPGFIAIVLAGVHKRKCVIVLKQLEIGLLLVTEPHKLNCCPMRR